MLPPTTPAALFIKTAILCAMLSACGFSETVLQKRDATACDGCSEVDAGSLDLSSPPTFDPGPCTLDGWCWVLPHPQGNALRAVWGSSASNIYAVGDARTIVHFDGNRWQVAASGLPADKMQLSYRAIWGASAKDVFVAGDEGAMLHFNGNAWRSHYAWPRDPFPPAMRSLWGASRTDVFAVGDKGTILHFDGKRWSKAQSPVTEGLNVVWGAGRNEVFAVGQNGVALRFDGQNWQVMESPTKEDLTALWGISSEQLFAGTRAGTILHFNGDRWSTLHGGNGPVRTIWGRGPNDVFFALDKAVLHYDGKAFSSRLDKATVDGLFAAAGGPLHAVGSGGAIYVEDGMSLTRRSGEPHLFTDLWARSASEILLASYRGIMRWDGSALTTIRPFGAGTAPTRICGQPGGGVIAIGPLTIHHRDAAGKWSEHPVGSPLKGLWCDASSEHAVAVGWDGAIMRFDANTWTEEGIAGGETFNAVWGSAPSNIYAVGWGGQIAHYGGEGWTLLTDTGTVGNLEHIVGRSPSEIYLGSGDQLYSFDGAKVTRSKSVVAAVSALGGSPTAIFAADRGSHVLRLESGQWRAEASPIATFISAISVGPDSVWAVGFDGALLRRDMP